MLPHHSTFVAVQVIVVLKRFCRSEKNNVFRNVPEMKKKCMKRFSENIYISTV